MKAVILKDGNSLAVENVPEPRLQAVHEAIVRVTAAAICGSDVHGKNGMVPGVHPGNVMGHEFMGVVEEVGEGVLRLKRGDRVAAAPATWCGVCPSCRRGYEQACVNGGVWGGGDIFGRGLAGAQTSYIRVPFADNCLASVPDSIPDDEAVLVGDVFQTGYHATYEGHIGTGDTVAIFGCGPIGLGALIAAWQFGPQQVLCVDIFSNRLSVASELGAVPINAGTEDPVGEIRTLTSGEGADVVIEAIGNPQTFLQSLRSVKRGGSVSVVGIFPGPAEFPLNEMSVYGVRISMGLGHISRMSQLMALLERGRVRLNPLITHSFSLEDAPEAYHIFENHKDRCLKVLLKP
jgi:threonine dehydrogenase-like Zn-dependent dehydrogenase